MLSVEQALDLVLEAARPLPGQTIDLRNAGGRFLTETIRAAHDSPPFDNSAMDGYAVRCVDLEGSGKDHPVTLALQGEVIAGDGDGRPLEAGKTLRINTGAPIPSGSDAVVQLERVGVVDDGVRFEAPPRPGLNIRRRGEDYQTGSPMLEAGQCLDARAVGLLASLGLAAVPVGRRPSVALLASGNELVEPGGSLQTGQIYNSSRYCLGALVASFGGEVHDLGVVADTREATLDALGRGLEFDVLITTGGVSMGSHDLIRPTLLELGARQILWKAKQKPGKPIFLAQTDRTLCFGLPGNPVSFFVMALVYMRGALRKMQGAREWDLPWEPAVAAGTFKGSPTLTVFARADFAPDDPTSEQGGPPRLVPSTGQGSHQFSALAGAAGLVRIPEGTTEIHPGETVDFLDFRRVL